MHENDVTDLLLGAVVDLSPAGQRRVIRRCFGVPVPPRSRQGLEVGGRTAWLDARLVGADARTAPPRTVLVVLAGDALISDQHLKTSGGSEVDGVLVLRGELCVLLEVKLPGNPPTRNPLKRHARAWGLEEAAVDRWHDIDDPPDGFGFVSWASVIAALQSGLGLDETDRERVAALLKALPPSLMIGAASGPAFCTPVEPAPLVASAHVDALLANVDLAAVGAVPMTGEM